MGPFTYRAKVLPDEDQGVSGLSEGQELCKLPQRVGGNHGRPAVNLDAGEKNPGH